eukprot:3773947-Alexandrium_andersonii.AAC.1
MIDLLYMPKAACGVRPWAFSDTRGLAGGDSQRGTRPRHSARCGCVSPRTLPSALARCARS